VASRAKSPFALSKASRRTAQDPKAMDVAGEACEECLRLLGGLQPCRERLAAAALDHRHDRQGLPALAIGSTILEDCRSCPAA
jgi:hypothetical protein